MASFHMTRYARETADGKFSALQYVWKKRVQ